jgi:hypothetical protein
MIYHPANQPHLPPVWLRHHSLRVRDYISILTVHLTVWPKHRVRSIHATKDMTT